MVEETNKLLVVLATVAVCLLSTAGGIYAWRAIYKTKPHTVKIAQPSIMIQIHRPRVVTQEQHVHSSIYTPQPTNMPAFYVPVVTSCLQCGGDGKLLCPICSGLGITLCPSCRGKGYKVYEESRYISGIGSILIPRVQECATCGGLGLASCLTCLGSRFLICSYCGGRGKIVMKSLSNTPAGDSSAIPCPDCGGTGMVKDYLSSTGWRKCARCWGSGWTLP